MELMKVKKKLGGLIKQKYNNKLKKIYFCGIQIYKKYLNQYYQEQLRIIRSIYTNRGFTKELNQMLELIFQSYSTCTNYDSLVWLIYLHSLIEQQRFKEAEQFLKRYIHYFGHTDLDRNIVVSDFVNKLGINTNDILKSAELYNHIANNKLDKTIFENKTIAVVGNSGCEIGKNKGNEIDEHDIVIRFNNYPEEEKYIKDYGSKTNIWIRNMSPYAKLKNDLERYDYIIQHENMIHRILKKKNIDLIYDTYHTVGNKFFVVPDEVRFKLAKEYDIYRPTSGCTILYTLYYLLGSLKNIDVYGFAFLSKDYNDTNHYYHDEIEAGRILENHDFRLEIDVLSEIFNKKS